MSSNDPPLAQRAETQMTGMGAAKGNLRASKAHMTGPAEENSLPSQGQADTSFHVSLNKAYARGANPRPKMQLQFLGTTDTVTGSKYLLTQGKSRILLDCGLFQGYKQLRLRNWSLLPVSAASIGSDPHACAHRSQWLTCPSWPARVSMGRCPAARRRTICAKFLPDCGHLLEEEAEILNRHKRSRHSPALPLYTRDDAQRCLRLFKPLN